MVHTTMSLEDISLLDEDLNDPPPPDAHHHPGAAAGAAILPRSIQWRRYLHVPCDPHALQQQRTHYSETLCASYYEDLRRAEETSVEQQEGAAGESNNNETGVSSSFGDNNDGMGLSLDPLSAMVQEEAAKTAREQELELNYRKEKALRKRGQGAQRVIEEEPDDCESYRQLIHKDLQRLPSSVVVRTTSSLEARKLMLQRILYIFATQHSNAGYLQGMHEIASYVLYALGKEENESAEHTEADCYILTEKIVTSLFAAYDVLDEAGIDKKPLEAMSRRIVQATARVWPQLHTDLVKAFAHIPSQLIFTKWIRLLFSRELTTETSSNIYGRSTASKSPTNNAETVLKLWDALLESASQIPPQQTSSVAPLQLAAEAFAVARLWQHGNTILHLCQNSVNDLLHWFMNVPPEPALEVSTLILRMRVVLLNDNSQELPPPMPVPPDVLALTAQSQQQQLPPMSPNTQREQQQQQQQRLWESSGPLLAAAHPKLASFTEKLAAKTQSIQKLISEESQSIQKKITEEWESIQKQHEENLRQEAAARRQREEEARQLHQEAVYNLDYYGERGNTTTATTTDAARPSCDTNSITYNNEILGVQTSPTVGFPQQQQPQNQILATNTITTSGRMQNDLSVLQQFLLNVERQPGLTVPPQVWEALGDLQRLQNLLQQNEQPR